MLVFDQGDKTFSSVLDKHRLVPLGEWVPTWAGWPFRGLSAIGGLEAGDSSRLLDWSGPSIAAAICYEISNGSSLAEAVENGAEWIVAIANLDPYPIFLQRQFLTLAKLRSIETNRDLVSVSNTGPSALVLATGQDLPALAPFTSGTGVVQTHLYKGFTGYVLWREAPIVGIMLIAILALIYSPFLLFA